MALAQADQEAARLPQDRVDLACLQAACRGLGPEELVELSYGLRSLQVLRAGTAAVALPSSQFAIRSDL
jgi:hypothetical protein